MKKNAFSLVELLAVIVLLGTIMLIAVAAITNFTTSTKTSTLVQNEKMIVKAAENYLASGAISSPINVGSSIEIRVSDLQNSGYLDPIKSPYNQSVLCNGYVIVTKLEDEELSFTPHLDCLNGIASAAADGLVAHYTFDDFQQPTTNMQANPLNFTWNSWAKTEDGWATSIQTLKSDYDDDGQMRKYIITAGNTIGGSNFQIYSGAFSITAGKTYGISFYVKGLIGRRINVSIIQSVSPYVTYSTTSKDFTVTSEWQRFEGTYTSNATAADARIQINSGYVLQNDEIYIYKPQLEERGPTPFVNGTRNATVKDYSIQGRNAVLDLTTTPIWNSNSKIGSGAYSFDGTSASINTGYDLSWNASNSVSISFWILPDSISDNTRRGIVGKKFNNFEWSIYQQLNNIGFVYWDNGGNHTNGMDCSATAALNLNEWTHVTYVWNGSSSTLYINGQAKASKTATNPALNKDNTVPMMIGGNVYTWGDSYFKGSIDDVKIYNRALSANEILLNYNIDLYKSKNK